MSSPSTIVATSRTKFRVFVDFWNFQLTLNEVSGRLFQVDWRKLPAELVALAASVVGSADYSYDGAMVFTSYNSKTAEGKKHRNWAISWLDTQPGVQVECFERRPKNHPKCPACHIAVKACPSCAADMAGTIEKGVDTAIVTNMIRLALENAYEVGVLVTSDADLVPAVEFLDNRGIKIIHAGFPPHGAHLSRACWATADIGKILTAIERK